MSSTLSFAAGGYRFIPGVFQYSAGVAAEAGHRIERVRFHRPLPLAQGFAEAARIITAAGRPLTAFCACELRSPAPFNDQTFRAFNEIYVGTLSTWGLIENGVNPVARSNVCPEIEPPAEPALYAFSFTVVDPQAAPSFVVAGSGEAPEGHASYGDHAISPGDVSPTGLRAKAVWVLGEMERRMGLLGHSWKDTTATQLYTVYDPHPFLADEIVRRGAMRAALSWHFNRPPLASLDYEMDCRGVYHERVAV